MAPLDPEIAVLFATTTMVGFLMVKAGLGKHALERKSRKRTCPSCGRRIDGRVCQAH